MSNNPFDDETLEVLVRVNEAPQSSLCLAYIEEHWTDMRPNGLRAPSGPSAPDA